MLNLSCSPWWIPGPHLAGTWQVITPPALLQPWLVSRAVALATLNGYGPWPLFSRSTGGTHWLLGWVGTGPEVGTAYPRHIAVSIPGWSMSIFSACRT